MNSGFSLPSMLDHGGNAYATFENDPIFIPLFTAIGFTGTVTIGTGLTAATISTASIASAVSAGGGYLEFDHVRS